MQTVGEKLEETRKRKGISLSEAAEVTKIRKDFLQKIEANDYNYDLPEIYKRGFIKNYAKYLKLNANKVLSQYLEQQASQSTRSQKSSTELFSAQPDLNKSSEIESLESLSVKPSLGEINLTQTKEPNVEPPASEEPPSEKEIYIKTAIFGTTTLLFIFGIFWLIQAISQSMYKDTDEISNANIPTLTSSASETNVPSQNTEYIVAEITLKASGPVYVQIRQKLDNKILLSKQLITGEIQTIKKKGPVDVAFTKGNFITLISDADSSPIRPNTVSAGKITVE